MKSSRLTLLIPEQLPRRASLLRAPRHPLFQYVGVQLWTFKRTIVNSIYPGYLRD